MRAYRCRLKNDPRYSYQGGIDTAFLVLAEDLTSALMYTTEHLENIVEKLKAAKHPKWHSLRIISITEEYAVVTENIADDGEDKDQWVKDLVADIKASNND